MKPIQYAPPHNKLNIRMELLHTTPSITISRMANHVLDCNWIGPQTSDSITTAGAAIIQIVKEGDFKKVLNDNTRVTGPWNNAIPYTLNQWFPIMVDLGIQHFAWVYSPNIFANLSAKRATPAGNIVKPFEHYRDALSWLSVKP